VSVDPRRAGTVLAVSLLLTLIGTSIGLYVAGSEANSRADRLQHHGIRVEAAVTTCLGLLGGSGSNAAGYTCRGRFVLDGVAHSEVLPGNGAHAPGDRMALISDPGHPGDLLTPSGLAGLHPGAGLYVLPSILAGAALLATALGLTRYGFSGRRRRGGV
jgi:hypothetical protein